MSIQTLALLLLFPHGLSVLFISIVIRRQLRLFGTATTLILRRFRKGLFYLSLAILLSNFVPIAIDALTLFINVGRPGSVGIIGIIYSGANATTCFLSSVFVWQLYRLAADTKDITDFENEQLNK
jgi:hypothetical protein